MQAWITSIFSWVFIPDGNFKKITILILSLIILYIFKHDLFLGTSSLLHPFKTSPLKGFLLKCWLTFSSCKTETLSTLNTKSPILLSPPPTPGNHPSLLPLGFWLFPGIHISGIIYLSFCHRLSSLRTMPSKYIHGNAHPSNFCVLKFHRTHGTWS